MSRYYGLNLTTLFILLFVSSFSVAEVKPYSFVGVAGLAEQEVGASLFATLCAKYQLDCDIEMLPASRAEHNVCEAKSVGEIMRSWEYGLDNPDLLRVPTPYYYLQTALIVRSDNLLNIYSLRDIKDVNVGVIRGVKHSEHIETNSNKLLKVGSTEQLMNLLVKGRIDVAVTSRLDGASTLRKMNIENVMILPVELETHPLYFYLNSEYAHLLPILDRAIKESINSGLVDKWSAIAESSMFSESRE
ncbi:substrate-binding periplasmic protein [Shewanella sp. TC10]|uniref:substrate-binding periplasmic protein n=1 Tax=Shewanella sp. TC10 TaxID=1419739 RepID=UPI00129DED9B|nr:transporter substrate-binding domain-containing protein [Shewanella sp. TC10]